MQFTYIDYAKSSIGIPLFRIIGDDILIADKVMKLVTTRDPIKERITVSLAERVQNEDLVVFVPNGLAVPRPRFEAAARAVLNRNGIPVLDSKPRIPKFEKAESSIDHSLGIQFNKTLAMLRERDQQEYLNCFYCGDEFVVLEGLPDFGSQQHPKQKTQDHIVPRIRGGKIKVQACYTCNGMKSALSVNEFRLSRYTPEHLFWGERLVRQHGGGWPIYREEV